MNEQPQHRYLEVIRVHEDWTKGAYIDPQAAVGHFDWIAAQKRGQYASEHWLRLASVQDPFCCFGYAPGNLLYARVH